MRRLLYGFSALLIVFGIAIVVAQQVSHRAYIQSLISRAPMPGKLVVEVEDPTTFTIYNERRSMVDGGLWEAGSQTGLMVRAWGPDGAEVPLDTVENPGEYRVGRAHGIAIARFVPPGPGEYQIEGYYSGDNEAEMAVFALSSTPIEEEGGAGWLLSLFGILLVAVGIFWAGLVCSQRINRMVDYESRAVPTISSTRMVAALWRRIAGAILDILFLVIILMFASGIVTPLYNVVANTTSIWAGTAVTLIGLVVILAYFVVFEAKLGWTPGKFLLGLRVVTAEGRIIGWERSIVRNLLRFLDMMPFCYLVGLVSVWTSENNKRVGDRLSDTVVVER